MQLSKHAPDFRPAADDQKWWSTVAAFFPRAEQPAVNLEHGYFGAMAQPVLQAYEEGIRFVNENLSPYVRGDFNRHCDDLREKLAALINAQPEEILLTRSASESMQVLIGQYRHLEPGDAVLYCSLDYPAMRHAMHWLEERRGVTAIELDVTLPVSSAELLERYLAAIRDTPNLKLMLLSQVYPCNGQRPPVQQIMAAARARGIDVLLDGAHALGQLPVDVQEMQLDFAGFNLHKWIGAPLGVGFAYIRKSRLDRVEAHFGSCDYPLDDIRCRLHAGTPTVGAVLAVPAALAFHDWVGGVEAKSARISYLRQYWVSRAARIPGLRLLSPPDAQEGSALVAFLIDGMSAQQLQCSLLHDFGVFTVVRSVGDTGIVRATVAMTTQTEELDRFVAALTSLAGKQAR